LRKNFNFGDNIPCETIVQQRHIDGGRIRLQNQIRCILNTAYLSSCCGSANWRASSRRGCICGIAAWRRTEILQIREVRYSITPFWQTYSRQRWRPKYDEANVRSRM